MLEVGVHFFKNDCEIGQTLLVERAENAAGTLDGQN